MQRVYVESVISLAKAFVNYCEKKSNSNLLDFTTNAGSGNFNRFSDELDKAAYWNKGDGKSIKNGHEWCAAFINWLVFVCSDYDIVKTKEILCIPLDEENLGAGVEFLRKYFRAVGRYDAKPEKGDLVIFTTVNDGKNSADHVGLLTAIGRDGTIYTIEGNKDNKVSECFYPPDYWKILGYAHPRYDVPEDSAADKLKIIQLEEELSKLKAENEKLKKEKAISDRIIQNIRTIVND